ncbi:UPF0260 protein YcgN [hydrothermal vent metagenome]|uniref:UPF0260 protein YcgN n=1 Tax=hydrothermal vent metagenome TaxID=652676 RepID=A0A3B0XRG1_9ZZZZ
MAAFWETKSLQQMSDSEWESLCDGCARCCLLKLRDEDTDETFYTNVSCRLLNLETCRCTDYTHRKSLIAECLLIRDMRAEEYRWLPQTCAYRRLSEGKPLHQWHPLIAANAHSVQNAGITVTAFAVSEQYIHPEQLPEHIIKLSEN